jgi:hypothetical protein
VGVVVIYVGTGIIADASSVLESAWSCVPDLNRFQHRTSVASRDWRVLFTLATVAGRRRTRSLRASSGGRRASSRAGSSAAGSSWCRRRVWGRAARAGMASVASAGGSQASGRGRRTRASGWERHGPVGGRRDVPRVPRAGVLATLEHGRFGDAVDGGLTQSSCLSGLSLRSQGRSRLAMCRPFGRSRLAMCRPFGRSRLAMCRPFGRSRLAICRPFGCFFRTGMPAVRASAASGVVGLREGVRLILV